MFFISIVCLICFNCWTVFALCSIVLCFSVLQRAAIFVPFGWESNLFPSFIDWLNPIRDDNICHRPSCLILSRAWLHYSWLVTSPTASCPRCLYSLESTSVPGSPCPSFLEPRHPLHHCSVQTTVQSAVVFNVAKVRCWAMTLFNNFLQCSDLVWHHHFTPSSSEVFLEPFYSIWVQKLRSYSLDFWNCPWFISVICHWKDSLLATWCTRNFTLICLLLSSFPQMPTTFL